MKRKTNFDKYLETQFKEQDFAERFIKAGNSWEIAMQIADLRKEAGLSRAKADRIRFSTLNFFKPFFVL